MISKQLPKNSFGSVPFDSVPQSPRYDYTYPSFNSGPFVDNKDLCQKVIGAYTLSLMFYGLEFFTLAYATFRLEAKTANFD